MKVLLSMPVNLFDSVEDAISFLQGETASNFEDFFDGEMLSF